jgi:hypothetical protein
MGYLWRFGTPSSIFQLEFGIPNFFSTGVDDSEIPGYSCKEVRRRASRSQPSALVYSTLPKYFRGSQGKFGSCLHLSKFEWANRSHWMTCICIILIFLSQQTKHDRYKIDACICLYSNILCSSNSKIKFLIFAQHHRTTQRRVFSLSSFDFRRRIEMCTSDYSSWVVCGFDSRFQFYL